MTAPTDTLIDSLVEGAQRTQEAVTGALTGAVRTWADTVTGFAGGQPNLPDAKVVVDRWFEVAQTVLDTQKAIAKTVVGAGAQAAEVLTEQATKAAETVTTQTENVVGQAIDFEAFPDYWDATRVPRVKTLRFSIVPEQQSRIAQIKTGEADLIEGIAGAAGHLRKRGRVRGLT